MKRTTVILAGLALLLTPLMFFAGCGALGTNPSPPSKAESWLYNTQTNYVPTVQVVTNFQVVTKFETNTIPITNAVGVTDYRTNIVTIQQTNAVPATNTVMREAYTETLKPGVTGTVQGAGGILNTFFPGIGAIAVQGLLAVLAGWGYMRSSKLGDTSAALSQEIETVRAFIQKLPNGQAYDAAFVKFMQTHQGEEGVLNQVLAILQKDVSNNDAQVGAQQMQLFLQQLQASAGTPTPAPPKV